MGLMKRFKLLKQSQMKEQILKKRVPGNSALRIGKLKKNR